MTEQKDTLTLDEIQKYDNLTPYLSNGALARIGQLVKRGFELDEKSRQDAGWDDTTKEAMKIAKQTLEKKDFPWENASNVKFPLITMSSIDFASEVLPDILPKGYIVRANIMGMDKDDKKQMRADRVASFMSYQLMQESPDWRDGVDTLLHVLPVLGTVFKKTYYSEIEKRNISEFCTPDKIVVNYDIRSLDTARRVTHIIELYANDIITRQKNGLFNDEISIDDLRMPSTDFNDEDFPINLLEQHCWLDLDNDGYKEPYIVIVHKESGKVLRLVARIKSVSKNSKGEVTELVAKQYFTDFHFIRSPDGGFYSMGFGQFLLPLNESINTIINQLIDSGTLNTLQGGLIGRGVRLKNGEIPIKMGQWNYVDVAAGTQLSQNVVPFPTKEPSGTLFQLLGMLVQIGKDLSSSTDVMQGKQPAENVATGTLNTLLEQGSKMFTAIKARFWRSQSKEYMKLYELNKEFVPNKHYRMVLDDPEANINKDFEEKSCDIYPIADPNMSSNAQRIAQAQTLVNLRTADPRAVDEMIVESMQLDRAKLAKLLPPPPQNPPPPPEQQEMAAKIHLMAAQAQQVLTQTQLAQQQLMLEIEKHKQNVAESQSRINEATGRVWKMQKDALHNDEKNKITAVKMMSEQSIKSDAEQHKQLMDGVDTQIAATDLKLKDKKIATDAATSMAKTAADQVKHQDNASLKKLEIDTNKEIAKDNNSESDNTTSGDNLNV